MDDFGNNIMNAYIPSKGNESPPAFNWSAYMYFLEPEVWYIVN